MIAENKTDVNTQSECPEYPDELREHISPRTIADLWRAMGLAPDGVWSIVENTFNLMEIAEQEIAIAQEKYPDREKEIWKMFGQMCPPPGMSQYTDRVYRAHVREICDLTGRGVKWVQPTDAELLLCFVEFSQATPLSGIGGCLFSRLFRVCIPDAPMLTSDDDDAYASLELLYGAQADTLYQKIKGRKRP